MRVTSRQIVEKTIAALPVLPVATFYRRHENPVTDEAITAAEAMMAIDEPRAAAAHQALSALEDYNGASLAFAEALFLLGVEYGVKIAANGSQR